MAADLRAELLRLLREDPEVRAAAAAGTAVVELTCEVDRLVEAQSRTEHSIAALAEAQTRTEGEVAELTTAIDRLRQEVGSLSQNVGFAFEDVARTIVPGYLERNLGIVVPELEREFVRTASGEEEVDLFGMGKRGETDVAIVGEAKHRIQDRDVDRFVAKLARLRPGLAPADVLPFLVGFVVHPRARTRGRETGVVVLSSYDR